MAFATSVFKSHERAAREELRAVTWPGETLLAFTQGRLNPGGIMDRVFYVGLTPLRFFFVRKDQPKRVYSIYRSCVQQVSPAGASLFQRAGMRIHLAGGTMLLETAPAWDMHTQRMATKHAGCEAEKPYLTAEQFLQSIADIADLGLPHLAQALLREHSSKNAVIEIEPRAAELNQQISQKRWALRLSFSMLILALLYMAGQVIGGTNWNGPAILLALAAATELFRWHQARRTLALGLALLAAAISLAYSLLGGGLPNGIAWMGFGAAISVALTGRASRRRNHLAGGLFLMGVLVSLALAALTLRPALPADLVDSFSKGRGWLACSGCGWGNAPGQIGNGAYEIQAKQPASTYLAFPPAADHLAVVEFEARVPAEYSHTVGSYGVTCGYVDHGNAYRVEIDPIQNQFALLQETKDRLIPLTQTFWQPVSGTQVRSGITRVKVSCAAGKLTLALNGIEQGQASAKNLTGAGGLGLLVHTWPETGQEGFKVLFDRVVLRR